MQRITFSLKRLSLWWTVLQERGGCSILKAISSGAQAEGRLGAAPVQARTTESIERGRLKQNPQHPHPMQPQSAWVEWNEPAEKSKQSQPTAT